MKLLVISPERVQLNVDVSKVTGEGRHGLFTILPRHIDYAVLLERGILTYEPDAEGSEPGYVAVDGGILVKVGDQVRISTQDAVPGVTLEDLERTIADSFRRRSEVDRRSRTALARIESQILEEMYDFGEGG